MDAECRVCHVKMPKARVHYGGISCYSCRAFFRRTTQRENLMRCNFGRKCNIDQEERKSCPPCRYERCLRYFFWKENEKSKLKMSFSEEV